LSSWRVIVVGGTALLAEVWKRGIKTLGNIFLHVYASLETGWLTALHPDEVNPEGSPEEVKRMTSCGREVMNMEVKVVDEDDNEVRPGDTGEVIARGDALMKGYWKKPHVTEEAMKGGWFHTGDMGTMDEKGYLYLLGRKKDTIINGGKLLFPAEIEDVLYRHPAIEAAAVIGEPHEKLGEVAKAIVTLCGTIKVTPEEIIEFCQQSLPAYAIPHSVEFADTLPRTPSGKVLKRALRDKYLS